MADEISYHYTIRGLDGMIDALDRVSEPPDWSTTLKLEVALAEAFLMTQKRVHVISGRLHDSGHTESNLRGRTWRGEILYGGPPGSDAYYAIYEMARPGTRPDGTPHNFFAGLEEKFGDKFEKAVDNHFRPIRGM
jgi:hypothetical protein